MTTYVETESPSHLSSQVGFAHANPKQGWGEFMDTTMSQVGLSASAALGLTVAQASKCIINI